MNKFLYLQFYVAWYNIKHSKTKEEYLIFGLISTKDLYLLKLDMVKKYIFIDYDLGKYFLENNIRYVLSKKTGIRYIDIFTDQNIMTSFIKEKKKHQ